MRVTAKEMLKEAITPIDHRVVRDAMLANAFLDELVNEFPQVRDSSNLQRAQNLLKRLALGWLGSK